MSLDERACSLNERTNNEEIIDLRVIRQSVSVGNNKGRNYEGFSESSHSFSESSGSWTDFEGFRESSDKPERFNHNLEVLVRSARTSGVNMDSSRGCSSTSADHICSEPSRCRGIQETLSSLNESSDNPVTSSKPVWMFSPPNLLFTAGGGSKCVNLALVFNKGWKTFSANHVHEDIFRLVFPEVFVSQSRASIRSLDQILDTSHEDDGIPECMKNQLCINSRNIWRTLRDFDNTLSLRHPWSKSHGQESLLSVLGIDAKQKDCLKSQDEVFEEPNIKDNEDFRYDGFSINDCKALIQTKLSASTNSRHGQVFICNLFLKATKSDEKLQCVTVPRKKYIFATHNLKMKFFSSSC